MKIVDFETFNQLPAGTIFAPYEPCALLESLAIKADTGKPCSNGYFTHVFNGVIPLEPSIDPEEDEFFSEFGKSLPAKFEACDDSTAEYCSYRHFLILDSSDIGAFIRLLSWAKKLTAKSEKNSCRVGRGSRKSGLQLSEILYSPSQVFKDEIGSDIKKGDS